MINDDFNTVLQSDEFASEYEAWLHEVVEINSSPSYDWDTIHIEED
jgi:hypothetical protein